MGGGSLCGPNTDCNLELPHSHPFPEKFFPLLFPKWFRCCYHLCFSVIAIVTFCLVMVYFFFFFFCVFFFFFFVFFFSSLLLSVPQEGCATEPWHFLDNLIDRVMNFMFLT